MKDLHEGILELFAECAHPAPLRMTERERRTAAYQREYMRARRSQEAFEMRLIRAKYTPWNPGKAEPVKPEHRQICLRCGGFGRHHQPPCL